MVKTKIIATLGPSSNNSNSIRRMIMAGMDVARLNFSHGSHAEQLSRLNKVRDINKKYRRHIRIMQDLEGYRIRVGFFSGGREKTLNKGMNVYLTKYPDAENDSHIPFDYTGDLKEIKPGTLIYIDDGNIILEAKSSENKSVKAKVVEGGRLKERKGVNMPGARLPFAGGLTEKDKRDIEFGIKNKVEYIAQSFVRNKKDVNAVRERTKKTLPGCKIVAKIETREAIKNIDEIIKASDGIMIARGDMGISVPIYEIPVIQKNIIRKCNMKKKFAITATQMLEHMTEHSRPTRAEVTDVANAILDGTDFVMLSAETASGKYPVKSVKMMNDIIKHTENYIKEVHFDKKTKNI